jgi:MFS transporter, MHS family, proline/betaine transporter
MEAASTPRRALVAGSIGNAVEWDNFAVHGAFATIIAATYFPGDDPMVGLSATFAVFATDFLARPVGALVFGRLGDQVPAAPAAYATLLAVAAVVAAVASRETTFEQLSAAGEPRAEMAPRAH